MKKNFELFVAFFAIGAVTFGGGLAMMPLMKKVTCDKKKWATEEEIVDYYAVAQTLPGMIAANVATMIGYRVKKVAGAFFSLLGMITPSIIVICLVAAFIREFNRLTWVQSALKGIDVAVIALLFGVLWNMRKNIRDVITAIIAVGGFILVAFFRVNPSIVIIASALLSAAIYYKRMKKAIIK